LARSDPPEVLRRVQYSAVISWPIVALATLVTSLLVTVGAASREWEVVAIAVGIYIPVMVLVCWLDLRVEASIRRAVRSMGWTYSLWGPSAAHFGIAAPPFSGAGGLRTSAWGQGVFRGRRYDSFFVANDGLRWSGQTYVMAFRLEREYPTVRLTPARGLFRQLEGTPAVATEAVEFGRRWRIMAVDSEFAHAFLSPRVMQRLLAEKNPPACVTVSGHYAFFHGSAGQVLAPGRLALLADVVAMVPSGVIAKFSQTQTAAAVTSNTAGEDVIANAPAHTTNSFVRPEPRAWVAAVAFATMFAVPLVGPVVALILPGREGRRGTGSDWMLGLAAAMAFTQIMLVVAALIIY
jgi:hypothetical protein